MADRRTTVRADVRQSRRPRQVAAGPLVGIEGAPTEPPKVLTPEVSRWAVCDTASETMSGRPVITGINGDLTLGDRAREVALILRLLASSTSRRMSSPMACGCRSIFPTGQ